jgi:hypothetical protein
MMRLSDKLTPEVLARCSTSINGFCATCSKGRAGARWRWRAIRPRPSSCRRGRRRLRRLPLNGPSQPTRGRIASKPQSVSHSIPSRQISARLARPRRAALSCATLPRAARSSSRGRRRGCCRMRISASYCYAISASARRGERNVRWVPTNSSYPRMRRRTDRRGRRRARAYARARLTATTKTRRVIVAIPSRICSILARDSSGSVPSSTAIWSTRSSTPSENAV